MQAQAMDTGLSHKTGLVTEVMHNYAIMAYASLAFNLSVVRTAASAILATLLQYPSTNPCQVRYESSRRAISENRCLFHTDGKYGVEQAFHGFSTSFIKVFGRDLEMGTAAENGVWPCISSAS